jgi:hypothetical protein
MSGVRSMTATSGPGVSLKAENLGLAQMAEVPLVLVDVMRGGPSTGLPTRVSQGDVRQAKNPSHGDYRSITRCAGNLAECYTEVVRAFNLFKDYSNRDSIRKSDKVDQKDRQNFLNWHSNKFENKSSDFLYYLDRLLFEIGKTVKINRKFNNKIK